MNEKPKILIFIDWFLPGYKAGGPIKSVFNIINSLNEQFSFDIITSDRDINDTASYPNVLLDSWIEKENYRIIYLSKERKKWIKNHIKANSNSYNKFYFNSIFSKDFSLYPIKVLRQLNESQKIILAPRGMLGKGAISIKPVKKIIFLKLSNILGHFENIKWHATNKEEVSDIKRFYGQSINYVIASNLCSSVLNSNKIIKESNTLKLCFFSRISPKKNLDFAIEVLNKVDLDIQFDIYGSIEDHEYWAKIENRIKESNNTKINYKGPIHPNDVISTLNNYHFLFLPTFHENFGHVIFESLSSGCGLIISNNTPWRNLDEQKLGWDIELNDKSKFENVLNTAYTMNQKTYDLYRESCTKYADLYIKTSEDTMNTIKLFHE